MARRRGFFAEIHHQNQLAAKRQAQQQRQAVRDFNRAVVAQERAASAHRRAVEAAQRASAAEQVRLNKIAAAAWVAECEAEAVQRTAAASSELEEIDGLLSNTLQVDDWVDLNALRQTYQPASFLAPTLTTPISAPSYLPVPPQPIFLPPTPPSGFSARLGGQGRYQNQLLAAQTQFEMSMSTWALKLAEVCELNGADRQVWRSQERDRVARLERARAEHDAEIRQRVDEIRRENAALDTLIIGVRNEVPEAIEQYIGIVLADSTYPEAFEVDYDYDYMADDKELVVTVLVPSPDRFPTVKAVRYVKAKDDFATTHLSATEIKRRYNAAVHQTALRTAHEVFEADRQGIIEAISLTIAVETVHPATGHDLRVHLAQLAVDRPSFLALELARVEPIETLKHLSAAVSKNSFGLVPIAGPGVRG